VKGAPDLMIDRFFVYFQKVLGLEVPIKLHKVEAVSRYMFASIARRVVFWRQWKQKTTVVSRENVMFQPTFSTYLSKPKSIAGRRMRVKSGRKNVRLF